MSNYAKAAGAAAVLATNQRIYDATNRAVHALYDRAEQLVADTAGYIQDRASSAWQRINPMRRRSSGPSGAFHTVRNVMRSYLGPRSGAMRYRRFTKSGSIYRKRSRFTRRKRRYSRRRF